MSRGLGDVYKRQGFAYRYADFSDVRVQVLSGTLEYYFTFPAWVTGTYFYSISQSSRTSLDGDDNAFAVRGHYQALPRLTVHAGYAYGGESYEDLSIDRVGHFQANTVEGGADVAVTEHVSVRLGGAYQLRDDGRTVTTAAASVAYRWR